MQSLHGIHSLQGTSICTFLLPSFLHHRMSSIGNCAKTNVVANVAATIEETTATTLKCGTSLSAPYSHFIGAVGRKQKNNKHNTKKKYKIQNTKRNALFVAFVANEIKCLFSLCVTVLYVSVCVCVLMVKLIFSLLCTV